MTLADELLAAAGNWHPETDAMSAADRRRALNRGYNEVWRKRHAKALKQSKHDWYMAHRGEVIARSRAWRKAHKEDQS